MSRPLEGFPTSWGSQRASVFPHTGPASYTQVTVTGGATAATGGDTVEAVEAGFKYFDELVGGVSDSGAYFVDAIPINPSSTTSINSSALSGIPATTYRLRWMARVTASLGGQSQVIGTEAIAATDLSAEVVRLVAVGPK